MVADMIQDWSDKTILVAEDVAANYMLIEAVLKATRATVIWAQNGKQAVDACFQNDHIDIVLMDIRMPEMDGILATREIKKFRKSLPIVAQTAFSFNGEDKMIMEAGCIQVITKPISPSTLLSCIREHI